jgi:hypothetical protein
MAAGWNKFYKKFFKKIIPKKMFTQKNNFDEIITPRRSY